MSGHQRSTPPVSGPARVLGARHLGDGGAVVLAAVTAFGAWRSVPLPMWPPVVVVVVALVARRPFLMIVGVGLLA